MSQNDMSIADQPGAAFLADVNSAIQALVTNSSGATAPATTYAYQWWADTTTGILKQRNSANSGWIDILKMSTGAPVAAAPRATRIDVASVAGTVDLTANAPDTDDIRLTGALAITGFTVAAGRVLRVVAGGASSLANNANIVTQTGATLQLAANDTLMLRATAANVVEVLGFVAATPVVATSLSVQTRQTVLSGPVDTNGQPTFLPATSVNLNLTSQNVSTGANALVATAAGGSNANGAVNVVGQATANLTWTGFTANQTNYMPVSISGGALTALTPVILQPIEQMGGTPSVTNGQYTYNVQQGIMYLGNGTTAPAVNHVIVGQAVAGASSITSTTAYAYQRKYIAPAGTNPNNTNTAVSLNHNCGTSLVNVKHQWVCNSADAGYSVGDPIDSIMNGSGAQIWTGTWGRLSVGYISNIGSTSACAKGTSTITNLALAKWDYRPIVTGLY